MAVVWSLTQPELPTGSEFTATGTGTSDQQNTYTIDSLSGYSAPMNNGKICLKLSYRHYIGTGGSDASLSVKFRVQKNGVYLSEELSATINCSFGFPGRTDSVYLVTDAVSTDRFTISILVIKNSRERANVTDMSGTPLTPSTKYTNKVIINGITEIDLTSDTVTPETLLQGYTAHNAAGEIIVGTAVPGWGSKTVTLIAPKNSTVSWTGDSTGSINMGSLASASVILDPGTYTFTNTLVVEGASETLFTQTVAVVDDMTIKLYPSNALYWYGIECEDITGGWTSEGYQGTSAFPVGGTPSKNDNSMTVNSGNGKSCAIGTVNPVSGHGYMSITFRCKTVNNQYFYFGLYKRKSPLQGYGVVEGYMNDNYVSDITYGIGSTSSPYYAGFFIYNTNSGIGTIYAITVT